MHETKPGEVNLYLVRHGQTEWAVSGRHTGKTDIPLTEAGRQAAMRLREPLSKIQFSTVLSSPRSRAYETAKLAGFDPKVIDDLAEVDYGDYEGLTTIQIREKVRSWTVWGNPIPNGETLEQAAERCQKVIRLARHAGGNVLLFAHGHILRVLAATWLELPPSDGRHFMLDTSTISILSYERESPAVKSWNAPVSA